MMRIDGIVNVVIRGFSLCWNYHNYEFHPQTCCILTANLLSESLPVSFFFCVRSLKLMIFLQSLPGP